jgi:hypothetical protein
MSLTPNTRKFITILIINASSRTFPSKHQAAYQELVYEHIMKNIQIVCPKPLNSRKGCERSKQYSDDHGSNTFYGSLVGPRGGDQCRWIHDS